MRSTVKRFASNVTKAVLNIGYMTLLGLYVVLAAAGVIYMLAGCATASFTWMITGILLALAGAASNAMSKEMVRLYERHF